MTFGQLAIGVDLVVDLLDLLDRRRTLTLGEALAAGLGGRLILRRRHRSLVADVEVPLQEPDAAVERLADVTQQLRLGAHIGALRVGIVGGSRWWHVVRLPSHLGCLRRCVPFSWVDSTHRRAALGHGFVVTRLPRLRDDATGSHVPAGFAGVRSQTAILESQHRLLDIDRPQRFRQSEHL